MPREIERKYQAITLPDWIGKEVTDDPRYYNANLIAEPYTRWQQKGSQ